MDKVGAIEQEAVHLLPIKAFTSSIEGESFKETEIYLEAPVLITLQMQLL